MQVGEMYKGTYLKAADIISSGNIGVTIARVTEVTFDGQQGTKYAVWFNELEQGLVMNKTNAMAIAAITGSNETNDWTGSTIMLTTEPVLYQGQMVPSVRVHPMPAAAPTAPQPALAQPVQMAAKPVADEDIPF